MKKFGYIPYFEGCNKTIEASKNLMLNNGVCPDNLFVDDITVNKSNPKYECPELERLLRNICHNTENKILYVQNITDLGRYPNEIIRTLEKIFENKTDLIVLDGCIDTTQTTNSSEVVKMMLVAIFQQIIDKEALILLAKQKKGRKLTGKKLGRPKFQISDEFIELCKDWNNGLITKEEILKRLSITKSTLYKYCPESLSKINRTKIFK